MVERLKMKQQLEKRVRKDIQFLTHYSGNAHIRQKIIHRVNIPKDLSTVTDKKELKHFKKILAQRKWLAKKLKHEHIGLVMVNPNTGESILVCSICGTYLSKVTF